MQRWIVCVLICISLALMAAGQNPEAGYSNVMGPHANGGRGCIACHQPHASATEDSTKVAEEYGQPELWGQSTSSPYGHTVTFGLGGTYYVEVTASDVALDQGEVGGILLCVSCHDGNIAPLNMMNAQIYEQRVGLITNPAFGSRWIPTLMDAGWRGNGALQNPHPFGVTAVIPANSNGLIFANGQFSVQPGSGYEKFVHSYGWPALAPGRGRMFYGVNHAGQAFVTCTTCHDQHVLSVYTSNSDTPIGGDVSTKSYTKIFFMSGPYSPNTVITDLQTASSAEQFCRQCHFNLSNEGNHAYTILTTFQ